MSKYSVLVADDEIMIKQSLRKLIALSGLPFEVAAEAEDGREALEAFERIKPDVVITDIYMPELNGIELIAEIRKRDEHCPIVIVSGYGEFQYAQQGIRYNIQDYLLKPVRPDTVTRTLSGVLRRLAADRRSLLREQRWLVRCKEASGRLAEALWRLDEAEVSGEWSSFWASVRGEGAETASAVCQGLMALLHNELSARLGNAGLPPFQAKSAEGERLCEQIDRYLREAMGEIRSTRQWGHRPQILQAVEYIGEHLFREAFGLQEAAGHVGMSPSYFSKLFKEEMGIGFMQYVTERRMEEAKRQLNDPRCRSSEIAYAVGYSDYPHFAKAFKKYTGLSPSEYRKRIGFMP